MAHKVEMEEEFLIIKDYNNKMLQKKLRKSKKNRKTHLKDRE